MTHELDDSVDDIEETNENAGKDRHFVTALARGLEILSCFKTNERYLGNQQIAQRTGLPKPTVSRFTFTLTQLGYLNYSETLGKYSLGTAVLSIGNSFLSSMTIRQIARPLMQELADSAGASVAMGTRDRLQMVYIESCRSTTSSFVMNLDVGSRLPIMGTSMGRAYLCGLPDLHRDRVLDQLRKANQEDWPRIKAMLETAQKEYEQYGFCLSIGEWKKDVNAVAVPYMPADGSDVLSISCGGPAFTLRRHTLEDHLGPALVTMVKNIHTMLNQIYK